ncbi:hypothetical protein L198_04339 [Cryptococcus wingfieldii CBS 7118]|uniref:Uncharacterized protein n=1 Tax=Cryptococcus wingfieldii CBS 7118 TaxID=1295528 RepID=A0A1E3J705_9TREE|nr:hypothetical protein L198_04339 [Cryptococcus wingfieldii CBS 7118]ODN95721.1 hypothetical protein L198_04339 [Cryptococcus wingfieldii CBS 7118]
MSLPPGRLHAPISSKHPSNADSHRGKLSKIQEAELVVEINAYAERGTNLWVSHVQQLGEALAGNELGVALHPARDFYDIVGLVGLMFTLNSRIAFTIASDESHQTSQVFGMSNDDQPYGYDETMKHGHRKMESISDEETALDRFQRCLSKTRHVD